MLDCPRQLRSVLESLPKTGDASVTTRRGASGCRKTDQKSALGIGSKLGPKPPKHRVKRGFGRYQKARRVNNIDFLAKSAKPPSPVQIRAAPPKILRNLSDFLGSDGLLRSHCHDTVTGCRLSYAKTPEADNRGSGWSARPLQSGLQADRNSVLDEGSLTPPSTLGSGRRPTMRPDLQQPAEADGYQAA
jgi:hypothetical protein